MQKIIDDKTMVPDELTRMAEQPLVSIIIPVIRPDNMPRLVKLCAKHAGINEKFYEILTAEDKNRIGCPKMVKAMVAQSRGDMIMFLGDDTIPWKGYLKNALKAMEQLPDGWGLVGLNDQVHDGNNLATHWLAHKDLLPLLDGEFFHTGYKHCFCDNELIARCKELGRYAWAPDAKLKHNNPIVYDDIDMDPDYYRVYGKETMNADRALFDLRLANDWKTPRPAADRVVAIGTPSHGQGKADMWDCLERLRFYSNQNGIKTVKIRQKGSIVHHGRNRIVHQTRTDFPICTHLMMVDDDMTFPPETLETMLNHDKDVIITNAYRKVPPFAPIAQVWDVKEERFKIVHFDPAEGQLYRISTGGTGIVLFNMEVFNTMPFPWFDFMYADDDPKNPSPEAIEGKVLVGEDLNFFMRMKSFGLKLYCDFSIEIGHIGDATRTWKDYEESCLKQEQLSEQESAA